MKRSLQEYVELVVFGLIALLVGTGLLWVLGWVLSLGGVVLKGLAGLLWMLLRFIVPVAIAGGLVYFLVKAAQDRQKPATAGTASAGTGSAGTGSGSTTTPAGTIAVAPAPAQGVHNAAVSADETVSTAVDTSVAPASDKIGDPVSDTGGNGLAADLDAANDFVVDMTDVSDDVLSSSQATEDDEDEEQA